MNDFPHARKFLLIFDAGIICNDSRSVRLEQLMTCGQSFVGLRRCVDQNLLSYMKPAEPSFYLFHQICIEKKGVFEFLCPSRGIWFDFAFDFSQFVNFFSPKITFCAPIQCKNVEHIFLWFSRTSTKKCKKKTLRNSLRICLENVKKVDDCFNFSAIFLMTHSKIKLYESENRNLSDLMNFVPDGSDGNMILSWWSLTSR